METKPSYIEGTGLDEMLGAKLEAMFTSQMSRPHARQMIIDAANKFRLEDSINKNEMAEPYKLKHIQLAVCVCRRNKLIDPTVLLIAGFNAKER